MVEDYSPRECLEAMMYWYADPLNFLSRMERRMEFWNHWMRVISREREGDSFWSILPKLRRDRKNRQQAYEYWEIIRARQAQIMRCISMTCFFHFSFRQAQIMMEVPGPLVPAGGHITTNLINRSRGGAYNQNEMPSCIAPSKDLHHPAKSNAQCLNLRENELPPKSVCTEPSPTLAASLIKPTENPNQKQFLLAVQNAQLGEIFVGAAVHEIPSQHIEFDFFNAKDMANCVGVGVAQGKVTLHNDLSITIKETPVSERELKDTWMPFLSNNSYHLVMKVGTEVPGMQVKADNHAQAFVAGKGETLSGFDETYDAAKVSWPLLYDMARFILANDLQCTETNGKSSSQGSGSFEGNSQGNMRDKLDRKRQCVMKQGNLKGGGGDGNEDGLDCNQSIAEGDCPPVVLKVTMYPLPNSDILNTQVNPFGLEGACIAPSLVFEFRRNGACKRISINTQTRLQLASQIDICRNTNLFGWYHTNIMISVGCVDTTSQPQSGRVAVLKQGSSKILNPRTSYKYTTTRSDSTSNTDTYTAGGQAGLKLQNAWLGGMELQGSSSGSRTQQAALSNGENMEITTECLCGGFSFADLSNTELPALACFSLSYPLDKVSIWHNREILKGTGLFTTIEPHIEGTWIPLNGLEDSPYLFTAERSLKFHTKIDGLMDHVLEFKQQYVLPFLVNHAMSHLRSEHVEYFCERRSPVPEVLKVVGVPQLGAIDL